MYVIGRIWTFSVDWQFVIVADRVKWRLKLLTQVDQLNRQGTCNWICSLLPLALRKRMFVLKEWERGTARAARSLTGFIQQCWRMCAPGVCLLSLHGPSKSSSSKEREGEIDPFWPSWRHASPPLPNSVLLLCVEKKKIHPSEKGSINLPGCNLLPQPLSNGAPSLSL